MYIQSFFNYKRRYTNPVKVGSTTIGGDNPIRVQSMGNTNTNHIEESAQQAIRITQAGGELVRFTTQGIKEADNLGNIRESLIQKGFNIPLVADVHFNANVANIAAANCEKVRINPGNYVRGKQGDYTPKEWEEELKQIHNKLHTLIEICNTHKTAIRIGVNHGSLSPRILNRYGDTPEGLVTSCMEFLEFFKAENFHNIVLSVKSSNTRVMVQAVRLLVKRMTKANMHFPLHLGVTEAGNGEDGRIKSSVGIATLLSDGLGDTIRVSLSEDPECEIPVAIALRDYIQKRTNHPEIVAETADGFSPYHYTRYTSLAVNKIGGNNLPVVCSEKEGNFDIHPDHIKGINLPDFKLMTYEQLTSEAIIDLLQNSAQIIGLYSHHQNPVGEMRAFFHKLMIHNVKTPVIILRHFNETNIESLQIKASADLGPLFLDGFGDGIYLSNDICESISIEQVNSIAFGILQAARVRTSRTEYIACPSCGRTMFDLQTTFEKIKKATAHLTNLKIGIMGCIVNGPGEMADADYGYVGAGKGKISLYHKTECIEKNIPENEAIEHLMALIEKDQQMM